MAEESQQEGQEVRSGGRRWSRKRIRKAWWAMLGFYILFYRKSLEIFELITISN